MTRRRARHCLWVVLVAAPVLARAAQTPAPDQIERGRRIYVESASPAGGEIVAILGDGIEVPAEAVPCAGCHGRDGRGRPEGGLTPTDITWDRLARPYGAVAPAGRRHPPYDARSLERSRRRPPGRSSSWGRARRPSRSSKPPSRWTGDPASTRRAPPAALLGAPVEFADRLFAALPAPPRLGSVAAARYRQLADSGALTTSHLSAQVLALGAAEVLLEALTRTGRDLDRERLVESLESLRRLETSYLPPVTFGPGRRTGAPGVYLARIDLSTRTFAPAGGWIEPP